MCLVCPKMPITSHTTTPMNEVLKCSCHVVVYILQFITILSLFGLKAEKKQSQNAQTFRI